METTELAPVLLLLSRFCWDQPQFCYHRLRFVLEPAIFFVTTIFLFLLEPAPILLSPASIFAASGKSICWNRSLILLATSKRWCFLLCRLRFFLLLPLFAGAGTGVHQCYIWRFLLLPAFLLLRRTTTFCYYRAFFCYYRCMQVLEHASLDATSGSNDGVATAFLLPPVIADAGSGVLRCYIRQAMMLRPATLHWMLQQAIVGAENGSQRRRRRRPSVLRRPAAPTTSTMVLGRRRGQMVQTPRGAREVIEGKYGERRRGRRPAARAAVLRGWSPRSSMAMSTATAAPCFLCVFVGCVFL